MIDPKKELDMNQLLAKYNKEHNESEENTYEDIALKSSEVARESFKELVKVLGNKL
jgi:hypothetical protein